MSNRHWALILGLLISVGSTSIHAGGNPVAYDRETTVKKYVRQDAPPFPADNLYTEERAHLGKLLFFDPRLSAANSISCASCHNPAFSWGDALPKGIGHGSQEIDRRTPTILNMAWGELYFWDGRASSLEEQALGPIAAAGEMNLPLEEMEEKIQGIEGYESLFEAAYPGEGISRDTVAKAIATFERTVVSGPAPFDHWVEGDENAISDSAKRGFDIFNGKGLCFECHSGWNFTDDGFHDIGVASDDMGRGAQLPEIEAVHHAFKTPTLRNVALRGPYMHDGSEATLEEVVDLYNKGGRTNRPSLDINVRPLNLTESEIADLCAFMETLTGDDPVVTIPQLPR